MASRNPLPNIRTYEFGEFAFNELMQNRINNVLIVCSNYDYYMLEEDGRIDERIFNEYTALNLRYPPSFLHANSTKKALEKMKEIKIDLVITWLDIGDYNAFETSKKIKEAYPNVPIAALSLYSSELRSKLRKGNKGIIDYVFHWNGNVEIFVAIIKLTEDRMNAERDINQIGVKGILLVEDSLKFYSRYIPIFYKILLKQTRAFMSEGLNEHSSMMLMRGRPKILLATNYEDGISIFEKYKDNLLGVISDVNYYKDGKRNPEAGFELLKYVRKYYKYFPVLIQSSDLKNEEKALELKGKFLYKHSETLGTDLKNYITKYFSFGDFEFWDPVKMEVLATVKNLSEFQEAIKHVSQDSIVYHAKRCEYSKWLRSRALFQLAELFSSIEYEDFENPEDIKGFLIEAIKGYRIYRSRGVIAKFDKDKYDEYLGFARIGEGSLGGKGLGLAFIDSFLKRNKLFRKYENVYISIPRTVVLSTEIYDEFIDKNDLIRFVANSNNDEEILNQFISKPLPEWVLEDIRAFLNIIKRPIAVRSSSVLEDSHYQPFAGVFATYMIPNCSEDDMLEMVSKAVKSVFASAFFKKSKAYLKAASHTIEENKMAVILQELTGRNYDGVYYPNISGVARSINFYPIGDEKPNEGIVNIALGLGEIIVGGGRSLRFSPYHPNKILQLSSTDSALRETQKYFYGLDLDPKSYKVSVNETINKRKITVREAKNHRSLKFVASTYDLQNNIIKPGVLHDGLRVITFDSILKYNSFPLADILKDLLRIGQREMGSPIEIEFAINLDVPPGVPRIFSFLQIRPIVESSEVNNEIPKHFKKEDSIVFSESALGNGTYDYITDFVFVKPETFDSANTLKITEAIDNLNRKFLDDGKFYILAGPGRWGSSDPWLGIPVIWPQISAAKIIIETGLNNYRIEPSQGTHFFQNVTSFRVGYFTVNPFKDEGYIDFNYLNEQEVCYEDKYLKHIKFKEPLTIIIDGIHNKAIIFKEGRKASDYKPDIESSLNDISSGGYL